MLGADVNNLKHLKLTYFLTKKFIEYSTKETVPEEMQLNNEEKGDLLLAAIVHDWAEAIVGDQSYDLKTSMEEDAELQTLKKMAGEIVGYDNTKLIDRVQRITDTIIKEHDSKLGKIFNAIERVGYLRTGLTAWEKSKQADGNLKGNLEWLTNNVFLNQISKLIEYAHIYPAVAAYLKDNKELISDVFSNLPDDIFLKYKPEEIDGHTKKLKLAQQKWQEYCPKTSI